jgi:hypothetical protein
MKKYNLTVHRNAEADIQSSFEGVVAPGDGRLPTHGFEIFAAS